MKAFMSQPFGRIFDVPEPLRTKSYLTVKAVAEAERILAESEPITEGNKLYLSYSLQSPWSEDTFALAESLAAFIERS